MVGRAAAVGVLSLCGLSGIACGGRTAGEHLAPPTHSVESVKASTSVPVIEAVGEPLIVDWEPEDRADLEVQMRGGVPVVAYSPAGLRLLKDCSVEGSYGFVHVSPKQQVIRLQSRDEVRANLPASAPKLVTLSGDAGRERGIEIAMMIVGMYRTTRHQVSPRMLKGACNGATHFVRGATIGAFAMRAATHGWADSAAEMFGAGAKAGAKGERAVENRDGNLEACTAGTDKELLQGCGALLRLELVEVGTPRAQGKEGQDLASGLESLAGACPAGFVREGEKCARPEDGSVQTCAAGDLLGCTTQCDSGDLRSCVLRGVQLQRGSAAESSTADPQRAAEYFLRACDGGESLGCTFLGDQNRFGAGVSRDALRASGFYRKGCDAGISSACRQLGTMFYYADGLERDLGQAVTFYDRGCSAGDQVSCTLLGDLFINSEGEFQNTGRAFELFQRACQGDDVAGCVAAARALEFGLGVPRDEPKALALKHRLCDQSASLCGQLAVNYLAGRGVHENDDAAHRLLKTSCDALPKDEGPASWGQEDLFSFYSCLQGARLFAQPSAKEAQLASMAGRVRPVLGLVAERCQKERAYECFEGGFLHDLAGDKESAQLLWQRGCSFENKESCRSLKAPPAPAGTRSP